MYIKSHCWVRLRNSQVRNINLFFPCPLLATTLLALVEGVHLLTTTFLRFFAILSTFGNVRFLFFGKTCPLLATTLGGIVRARRMPKQHTIYCSLVPALVPVTDAISGASKSWDFLHSDKLPRSRHTLVIFDDQAAGCQTFNLGLG